jgi:hypothetical protein
MLLLLLMLLSLRPSHKRLELLQLLPPTCTLGRGTLSGPLTPRLAVVK